MNEKEEVCRKFSRSLSTTNEFDVYSMSSGSERKFRLSKSRKLKLGSRKVPEENRVVCTSYQTSNASFRQEQHDFHAKTTATEKKSSVYYINTEKPDKSKTENAEISIQKETSKPPKTNNSLWGIVKNIALLYKNPIYILISLCVAVYFWVFIPILTVVVDYSRDKGIEESDRKYLIHALTVGDLVGRVCFGWVTDKHVLSFSVFMALTYVFQGLFISLLPFAMSFWVFMAVLALYGVTAGIIFVYFPVLVHKYVDEENQSIAVGCMGLLSGVVTFGIPPLIGHFRDNVGSYDGLFYIIGLVSILTGFLWVLEPFLLKMEQRQLGVKDNV